jgi:hypothetical protein
MDGAHKLIGMGITFLNSLKIQIYIDFHHPQIQVFDVNFF